MSPALSFVEDLLDGVELPQPCLHLVREVAVVSGQDQDIVLFLLELEEVADLFGRGPPIRLHHQQDARAREPDVIQARHDLDFLIGRLGLALGLKQPGEAVDQGLLQLG